MLMLHACGIPHTGQPAHSSQEGREALPTAVGAAGDLQRKRGRCRPIVGMLVIRQQASSTLGQPFGSRTAAEGHLPLMSAGWGVAPPNRSPCACWSTGSPQANTEDSPGATLPGPSP